MPPFCDSLKDVTVNMTLAGTPTPDAAGAGAPNNALYVYMNITNTGPNPLALRGLRLRVRFSRGVEAWDGAWSAGAPRSFNASCWGAYLSDPSILADVFRARAAPPAEDMCRSALRADVDDAGIDISFNSGILCPGCSVAGAPGGFPVVVLQHSSFGALDVGSALVEPPACGAAAAAAPAPPMPLPGPERHPACAPWAKQVRAHAPSV
jgi:hypothetical protein